MALKRLVTATTTALLLLAILPRRIDGVSSTGGEGSCPAICSTPTVYGFTVSGSSVCACANTLESSSIGPSSSTDCVCHQCFLQTQEEDRVITYDFMSDKSCPFGATDCSNCALMLNSDLGSDSTSASAIGTRSSTTETTKKPKSTTPAPSATTPVPSSSTPSPSALATSITATSASKSSAWLSILTGVVFFICVLAMGLALIVTTKVYRKNARSRLQREDQIDTPRDDEAYRVSADGSVYFRAPGLASEVLVPDVHHQREDDDPSQTYEVLVFPIDGQQQQQQWLAVNAAPVQR